MQCIETLYWSAGHKLNLETEGLHKTRTGVGQYHWSRQVCFAVAVKVREPDGDVWPACSGHAAEAVQGELWRGAASRGHFTVVE